jgi:hypothetical protein
MRVNRNSFGPDEDKFFKTVLGAWLLGVLLMLGFWAGVIYIILHFVAKFW